jgi:acyl dehydratase
MFNFGTTFDDFTLLHYDDDYARKVGFKRRPVQGALVSCIIVKSIVKAFGDSSILRVHNLEFHEPIYPGSEITIELEVLSNIRNTLISLKSRVYVGETLHYEGNTKIKAFENSAFSLIAATGGTETPVIIAAIPEPVGCPQAKH